MLSAIDQCECTINYSEDKITGKATEMEYKGKGIFYCSSCKKTFDESKDIYQIRVKFLEKDGYRECKIIEPYDKRLKEPVQEIHPDRLLKDAMEENLHDGSWDMDKYVDNHEIGVFDIDLYWWWHSYYTYCGTEWDLEMDVVQETKEK